MKKCIRCAPIPLPKYDVWWQQLSFVFPCFSPSLSISPLFAHKCGGNYVISTSMSISFSERYPAQVQRMHSRFGVQKGDDSGKFRSPDDILDLPDFPAYGLLQPLWERHLALVCDITGAVLRCVLRSSCIMFMCRTMEFIYVWSCMAKVLNLRKDI